MQQSRKKTVGILVILLLIAGTAVFLLAMDMPAPVKHVEQQLDTAQFFPQE